MEKLFTEDDIKNAFECGVHYAKPAKTLSKTFNWRDALFGEGFRNEALFNCPGYSPTADSRVARRHRVGMVATPEQAAKAGK